MKIEPMRFKSYVWPYNPENVQVQFSQNFQEVKQPFSGSTLQNMGTGRRLVTGRGEFVGEECMNEFGRLSAVFAQGDTGLLKLPGIEPFPAAFTALKMVGEAQPDCVLYEFSFLEDGGGAAENSGNTGIYVCTGGENLWSVANRFQTTVDRLKSLNPMIEWPNSLEAGQEVVLP